MGTCWISRKGGGGGLESFLKCGLNFTILQLLGNKLSLTERLQSCEIGLAKISASSFRNLPNKLSDKLSDKFTR